MLTSRDLARLDSIFNVLTDPVKYKELMDSIKAESVKNQALVDEIDRRAGDLQVREERSEEIISGETQRRAELDKREAAVAKREYEVEIASQNLQVEVKRVSHTVQDAERMAKEVLVEKEAVALERDRVSELAETLKSKISEVDSAQAILDRKRDQAMTILGR